MKKGVLRKAFSFIAACLVLAFVVIGSTFFASAGDNELPFVPVETEHDWDEGVVTTPPTCTQDGVRTYICKLNATHTRTEVIPATGHTPAKAVNRNIVPATCTDSGGYDRVVRCDSCSVILSSTHYTTPPLGHTWDEWIVDSEPTTAAEGAKHRLCTVCEAREDEAIPAILCGDVDGNGKVNALDRARLARCVAKWEGYDETTVDLAAADVDDNGKVNALDRAVLARCIAKWADYETLPYKK